MFRRWATCFVIAVAAAALAAPMASAQPRAPEQSDDCPGLSQDMQDKLVIVKEHVDSESTHIDRIRNGLYDLKAAVEKLDSAGCLPNVVPPPSDDEITPCQEGTIGLHKHVDAAVGLLTATTIPDVKKIGVELKEIGIEVSGLIMYGCLPDPNEPGEPPEDPPAPPEDPPAPPEEPPAPPEDPSIGGR